MTQDTAAERVDAAAVERVCAYLTMNGNWPNAEAVDQLRALVAERDALHAQVAEQAAEIARLKERIAMHRATATE